MDVNIFYKKLFEDTLGLDVLGLENRYTELVKLIDRKTLLTFGQAIPARYITYLDLSDQNRIVRKDMHTVGVEYSIDDPILDRFNLPILGVERVEYNNTGGVDPYDPDSTAYYSSILASRQNITLEGVLCGSEYTYSRTLMDSAIPFKRYKEYRGGKILYLKNWGFSGTVEITITTRWPNIVSIPEEYSELFSQLAEYDVMIRLWNELKYMEDIVTPMGNLSLKNNAWESADQNRDEFLRTLRSKSLPDRVGASYFHIL